MDAVAGIKLQARRTARHLVWLAAHVISRRPWMVRGTARLLSAFPWLKHRIRRMINAPSSPESRREDSLSAAEARVLVDLRQAIADREGASK